MKRFSTFKIFLLLNIIFLAGCSNLIEDFKAISQPDTLTVAFDSNSGDGTMVPQLFTKNKAQPLSQNMYKKENCTFLGWANEAAAEEAIYKDEELFTATEDTTLYAVWEKIVYPCPFCGTAYDTEAERDKCNVQEGCPEYVKTYTYIPEEQGGLSGTSTEEQGSTAKPSINIDGNDLDNTEELNVVPKDTIAIIDTDGSHIWDPAGTGNVALNAQGAFLNGRKIVLSPYIISQYPVTTKLYETVMGVDPSDKTRNPMEPYDLNPVNRVTWYDAVIFCNKLSVIEGLEPVYYIDVNGERITDTDHYHWTETNYPLIRGDHKKNGYRLPTNAEWEFAARGGDPSAPDWNYAFSGVDIAPGATLDTNYQSDGNLDTVAYYKGNTGQQGPCTVGTKKPNRLGLYDMSGGICEWTYDFINDNYKIDDTPYKVDGVVLDPMGTETGTLHSVRGGSYFSSAFYCTTPYILKSEATLKKFSYGFRLCRNAN